MLLSAIFPPCCTDFHTKHCTRHTCGSLTVDMGRRGPTTDTLRHFPSREKDFVVVVNRDACSSCYFFLIPYSISGLPIGWAIFPPQCALSIATRLAERQRIIPLILSFFSTVCTSKTFSHAGMMDRDITRGEFHCAPCENEKLKISVTFSN